MVRGLLLDMDGVLVDTGPLHAVAWRELFAPFGVDFDEQRYAREASGRPRDAVIRAVLGDRPDHEALMAAKAERFLAAVAREGVPVVPGARALIQRARSAGLPVAVATSSRLATPVLAHAGLDGLFDAVVDRTQVAHGKPAPDLFLEAARRVGVGPDACLVVEDAAPGVQAAVAAGCAVVGLARDGGTQLGAAHRVVDHLDRIDPTADPR